MLSGSVGACEAKDGAQVQRYFVQHGRYTAGTATRYKPALLTGEATHQHLAEGLLIGTRFHSAPVLRVGDGKLMQLGESLTASVELAEPLGHEQLLHLRAGGVAFTVRGAPGVRPAVGSNVSVRMAPDRLHLFDAVTGVSLTA